MKPHFPKEFEHNYQNHLKRLTLNGMQPKTIEPRFSIGLVARVRKVLKMGDKS